MHRKSVQCLMAMIVAAIAGIAAGPAPLPAQVPAAIAPSDTVWQIRLADGSRIFGEVTAVTADRLSVRTPAGITMDIDRRLVVDMAPVRGALREGEYWPNDPNVTRLMFGPTGRMLEAGEGYVGVFELFLPFASLAVSDFFTLAGGTPLVPEVIGRVWYFAPKVGARVAPRTALSGGVMAFFNATADPDEVSTIGIFYLVGTQGTEDNAATAGIGWGFAGDEVANRPALLFGGETRVSPRFKLLTENYLITYEDEVFDFTTGRSRRTTRTAGILSAGVRFIGDRLSADAGIGLGTGDDSFCCLPLVNFVYNFGGRR